VHYLIDDDIEAGIGDANLPEGYRRRLSDALAASLEKIAADRIVTVITPSERLAEVYTARGLKVLRMDPAWDVPETPELGHFDGCRMRVACLATRSHVADLDLLREALEDPLRSWEFHHFMGGHAPAWLQSLERVVGHSALSWPAYRKFLRRARFQVCVYPMLPTRFNLARSCNKVMEHAMVGAASVFSSCVPFAGMVDDAGGGLLVDDGGWAAALRELTGGPEACRGLANAGHRLALATASQARARQNEIWSGIERGDIR
jgi:hypothetical protein